MPADEIEIIKHGLEHEQVPETAPNFEVETVGEKTPERQPQIEPEKEIAGVAAAPMTPLMEEVVLPQPKEGVDPRLESILEENLEEIFLTLPPEKQAEFKKEGERVGKEISKLMQTAKATFKKVFKLIFGWLRIIPGMNKFFMEQEAKIKADKIMKINQ